MARQRRGGFRPPEIRGTLGTLLRTTLEQASVVRDAIERSAREGRSRLDEALAHRRRKDALAELGELVLDLIRRGEIDLGELPEAQDLVRLLDDLDADGPDEPDDRIAQSPTRGRFDARSRDRARDRDRDPSRDRDRDRDRDDDRDRDRDDDGTVSATRGGAGAGPGSGPARWSPPKPAAPQRVWRPTLVDDEPPPEPRAPGSPRSPLPLPGDPHRKGGISFDDDDDLADYMHPDDVPPKPPTDGDR
jgi:hypothetical protein